MLPIENNFTPNDKQKEQEASRLLAFFMWAPNEFFQNNGISPSKESVNRLKKLAREIAC